MRAFRPLRRGGRGVDAKTPRRQRYCRATVRHLRRTERPVPARGGAAGVAVAGRGDGRGDAVTARLSDVIDVLEAAYPPKLAQDWDSVGLVCGDPSETVETVTVAVDATAAVLAEVPAS